ncbi:PREDICTED: transmembrane protein 145-like [Nicrophorus vespilloides]|uniref:Transmembrane protein 145-like n=1 Tax=Nicrophorus vespilloides TaxID=110193 RepID=A0ABM1NIA4_NICVS|nr:PREDICTED: transmembrane protein 145-like [Nicrophorus vespilloides]
MLKLVHLSYLLIYLTHQIENKYVEGELNTSENWAFIARFCFLSEEGQYEYYIEYEEDQGEPNLLLYYDADTQWPAVYKSAKTCREKESVLRIEQNQIINLTTRYPFRDVAGCIATPQPGFTSKPSYTLIVPTLATRKTKKTTTTSITTTSPVNVTFDYFVELNQTSISNEIDYEKMNYDNESTSVPTEITTTKAPIKKRATGGGRTIMCRNSRRFRSARERWWFIAISNCNASKGIHIKYRILMTNGPPGDYWHEHFSADEFYVLPVLMAFSVAYSFLVLAIIICSIELKSRQLLHTTYKLFVLSSLVQLFGILFRSMSFLKYAVNGIGSPKLKVVGAMFMGLSETCFLLLLLLLAKGYTVTRGRLPLSAGVKLTIFMCLYVVTFVSLFIYEAKVFDPGEVLYTYESPAGYGLIILRVIAWCMFIYSTVFTLKHYPEKANFYYPFNVFGTLWFIAGPAFILTANSHIDKWVRESIVCAVLLFIAFGGHLMFLLLTMPSVANKNFPYHVRTSQIGVMEVTGNVGNSSIEQFGHHAYEPTANGDQVIIPLSRRTEEIFGGLYSQRVQMGDANGAAARAIIGEATLNANNATIENVLSWSLAKNFNYLNRFESLPPNSESRRSSTSDVEEPEEVVTSPEQRTHQLDDWVREVPIELFTISKMVVTNNVKEE